MKYLDKSLPYVAIFIFVFMLMVTIIVPMLHKKREPVYNNSQEIDMISYTNNYRKSIGLATLVVNQKLNNSAKLKSNDLCSSGVFGHNNSNGEKFTEFINQSNYEYSKAGENLAENYNSVSATFNALLASKLHYDNIIGDYKEIGVSYNECNGTNIIVVHYGK